MINKFKDFLKSKFSRKSSREQSDQDQILDENSSPEDQTGEVEIEEKKLIPTVSIKEKISDLTQSFKNKIPALRPKSFELPKTIKPSSAAGPLLSPNLSKYIETILNRKSRGNIHQAFLVALICSVTYTLGKISAIVIKGSPDLNQNKDYNISLNLDADFNTAQLNQVKGINIFRTNTGLGKKNKVADIKCEEGKQTSNLPIKLINSIVLQDRMKSLASVQVRSARDLKEVREGEQIENLALLFKIRRSELVVKNLETGNCESIPSNIRDVRSSIAVMSPAATKAYFANKKISGIDNVGNKFSISKALLDEKLKDIASILTQARAIKIQNPDGSLSFKMTEIDPQGVFPYLGIQENDIINHINGKPIYDVNEVMSLFGRIKNLDQLQLGIKREGSDSTQEYAIKK